MLLIMSCMNLCFWQFIDTWESGQARHVSDYEGHLRRSKFCFCTYGRGWGIRVVQAMLAGCVPVIVQDHVAQPFEYELPWEAFSLRLGNADLPLLRQILHSISDGHYKQLLDGVLQYSSAFFWDVAAGGKAMDYTLLSLRRVYKNLKSGFYGING
ncbi:hypothetical protein ABPG75_000858 [Micractinium tetrahymenae]